MKKGFLALIFCLQILAQLEAKEGTVVALHGIMTDVRSFRPTIKAFQCTDLDVYVFEYPSRRKTFEEHGCGLVNYLQAIACLKPGEPINFVTHSSGALLLRSTLNLEGCPEEAKIGRVVMLAPPNKGSSLARRFRNWLPVRWVLGDRSGCELMNYDACDILEYMGRFPNGMEILVITGNKGRPLLFDEPNDGWVTERETSLEIPYYTEDFPLNHGDLLTSRSVLCAMKQFILFGP